jgi:UDP-glucose 4-epimerase
MGRVAGGEPTITHAPERRGEVLASVLDCSKAKKVLGWEPETTLAAGLEKTYTWFRARQ